MIAARRAAPMLDMGGGPWDGVHPFIRCFAMIAINRNIFAGGLALILSAAVAAPLAAEQVRVRSGQTWLSRRAIDAPGRNGAVLLSGMVENAIIGPATITRAYRAVETEKGAVLRKVEIKGLRGWDLERDGIRLRVAENVRISDFDLAMRLEPQQGRNLPEGIAIYEGRDIIIRNGKVSGFRMVGVEGRHTNGDGIATEGDVNGATIIDVVSSDNSDGGFDLKGKVAIDRVTARRNGRNFRFWHQATAGTITSIDPRGSHIWIGKGAVVRIDRLVARSSSSAPILTLDGGTVEIGSCDLRVPAGTQMTRVESSGNRVKLGPGCRL